MLPPGWTFRRNPDGSIGIFAPPAKPGESQRTSDVVYASTNRDLHELLSKFVDHVDALGKADMDNPAPTQFNASGSKYLREVRCSVDGRVDVYAVLEAFNVTCPARQHAIKKLLCAGLRGKGDGLQDLREARDAVDRAVQMETARQTKQASKRWTTVSLASTAPARR